MGLCREMLSCGCIVMALVAVKLLFAVAFGVLVCCFDRLMMYLDVHSP